MGNYVAGIPQTQQAKEGVSFWELARSVSAGTEKDLSKYRQFSEIPVLNMLFAQVFDKTICCSQLISCSISYLGFGKRKCSFRLEVGTSEIENQAVIRGSFSYPLFGSYFLMTHTNVCYYSENVCYYFTVRNLRGS